MYMEITYHKNDIYNEIYSQLLLKYLLLNFNCDCTVILVRKYTLTTIEIIYFNKVELRQTEDGLQ